MTYFEVAQAEKAETLDLFRLNAWTGGKPQKGVCMLPKSTVDTTRCEVARIVRNTGDQLEVVSMIVPRKVREKLFSNSCDIISHHDCVFLQSTEFQTDIYPETASNQPAMTGDEWLAGANKPPLTMSLKPGETAAPQTARTAMKSVFQLQKEVC